MQGRIDVRAAMRVEVVQTLRPPAFAIRQVRMGAAKTCAKFVLARLFSWIVVVDPRGNNSSSMLQRWRQFFPIGGIQQDG